MYAIRPQHLLKDNSLPPSLEPPQTEALEYVGRRVCKFFDGTPGAWYTGTIVSVSIEDDTAYMKVSYEADGEEEEMWWEDFLEWAVVEADTDPNASVSCDPGPVLCTPDDHQYQQAGRQGGKGASAGGPERVARWPGGEFPGTTQPRNEKRTASANCQVAQPGFKSHSAHGQNGSHAATDERKPELDDEKTTPHDEYSRPAARRRLNLEPYKPLDYAEPQTHAVVEQPGLLHQHPQQHQPKARHEEQQRDACTWVAPQRMLGGREPFAAGHLHRIQLVNFMCHDNLEVTFNKHVTFVAGRNGSGKSALLQGLQACLGAKARDTGRGSSLGGWVSKERRTAIVTLEIWNTTEQEAEQKWPPFRHDLYGSLIRIVRKISAGEPDALGNRTVTSSSYQFYAADGREVKPSQMGHSAAKEVESLAEHFNIDASNPLIVITQDKAREFHQITQGARCVKYEMYMAGTCLAKTRDSLAAAGANVERGWKNLCAHREVVRGKRDELRALERRLETLQEADLYKQQQADLEVATTWAIVEEARAGLKAQKQAVTGYPGRVRELEALVAEAEAQLAELQTREAALNDEMNHTRPEELPTRIAQVNTRRQAAKRRRHDLGRRLEAAVGTLRDLTDRRGSLQEELAALETEKRSEGLLQRVREHQEQVEAKQAEVAAMQAAATNLAADRVARAARVAEAEAAVEEHARAVEAARAAAQEARDAHGELLAAAGGAGNEQQMHAVNVRLWGAGSMALLAAVRAAPAGTFSQQPIGPVGLYLRRRADCDPALACCLELVLGHCLGLWLVSSFADGQALRRLVQQVRWPGRERPQIVVQPFRDRPLNYGTEPVYDEHGRLWRRVIDLVEPKEELPPRIRATLVNALLEQAKAANVVLVGSREEGQVVGRGQDRALAGRRIRKAFDQDGVSYSSLSARAMSTDIHTMPRTCRLTVDNRAQLAESERAVAARGAELQQAQAAEREARDALAAARRELQELQQRQTALVREERLCQSQLESLMESTPAAVSEAHSQELLNQLTATQRDMAQLAASQASLEAEMNNATAEVDAITTEVEALHRQSAECVARRQELSRQLNELAQRIQEAAGALAGRRGQLQAVRRDQQQAQARIDEFEQRVDQAYCAAQRICTRDEGLAALDSLRGAKRQELAARYPNKTEAAREELLAKTMTSQGLQQWTAQLTQKIASAEANAGGDLGAISVQLAAARTALERHRMALEAVAKKVSCMSDAQARRKEKFKRLRNQIEHISNSKFAHYMRCRNITASLQVDHEEERLDLIVRKNYEAEQATSLMQLSGGERSFTTSSFLLAMGEVLGTPFRAMDEYDVYMDNSARKLATIALLEYAWQSNCISQLVLLSPQDTSTLTEAFESLQRTCQGKGQLAPPRDFVKIVQLRPPRKETRQ